MEEILNFFANNLVATIIIAAVIIAAAVVLVSISLKKKRVKRDKEYAKMFEEVPIENDDSEETNANDNRRPEFAVHEMDWLKGERGFEGVLRTELPPLKNPPAEETKIAEQSEEAADTPENDDADGLAAASTENVTKEEKTMAEKQSKTNKKLDKTDKPVKAKKEPEAKTEAKLNAKTDTKFAVKLGAKLEAKKAAEAQTQRETKKAVGKWVIKEKGEGEFVAYLYANNKEVMLTSEAYSSPDGAKKGIATIRKNVSSDGNFSCYRDKNGNYFFKLKTAKNRFLCAGATYANESACLKSIESVKYFVDSPVSDSVEKDITIINYVPKDESSVKKYSGKWVITALDDHSYIAQLFASNGELLLSSESYASHASAKEAVKNISENGLSGNFIIDSDKKGRYFFKIRNAQKLTLCVGETYSQLSACESAIESVFGFLKTAKLAGKE